MVFYMANLRIFSCTLLQTSMTILDSYLFLFFDSFLSMLIMIPNSHMAFYAMLEFGLYNSKIMTLVGLLGDLLGGMTNYLIGYFLCYLKEKVTQNKRSPKFLSLTLQVQNKLFGLAVFSFVPLLGVLFTTFSGFFKVRVYKFVVVLLIGRSIYYLFINWY